MTTFYKPTSAGRRNMGKQDFAGLHDGRPLKSLTRIRTYAAARSHGKISVRHKGGAVKRLYRTVDFRQRDFDVEARVVRLEYDPNRSARIALIHYVNGMKAYILAPRTLQVDDTVMSSAKRIALKPGNRMPLKYIHIGTDVFNIEMKPGKGGQMVRGAGGSAQVMAREGGFVHVKLPSGEVRMIPEDAAASVGSLSNPEHGYLRIGKAGRSRHMGIRPGVRGVAMVPADRPHGGGEGRTGEGRIPKTPWGKPARGVKARKRHKKSNMYIVKRRKDK